jgi:hypothetical protein
MMVLFKIFAEAQEPEFIDDKGNTFGGEGGIAVGHLEVQMCRGRIA